MSNSTPRWLLVTMMMVVTTMDTACEPAGPQCTSQQWNQGTVRVVRETPLMAPDDLNHEIARIPVGAGLSPVATYHCKALADYLNVKYDGKEGYVSELDVSGA